jgi:hypothetical protein
MNMNVDEFGYNKAPWGIIKWGNSEPFFGGQEFIFNAFLTNVCSVLKDKTSHQFYESQLYCIYFCMKY